MMIKNWLNCSNLSQTRLGVSENIFDEIRLETFFFFFSRRTTLGASLLLGSFRDVWHFAAENSMRRGGVSTTDSLRRTEVCRINRKNRTSRSATCRDARSKRFDILFFAGPKSWIQIGSILNRLFRKKKTEEEKKNNCKSFQTFSQTRRTINVWTSWSIAQKWNLKRLAN